VQPLPHARLVPVAEPAPARHPRAEPELLREVFPLDAGVQTYKIPHKTFRSGNGFRPEYLNHLARFGSSGSKLSHNSSGTIQGDAPYRAERSTPCMDTASRTEPAHCVSRCKRPF
jgi:hypothetical protein